jgi:hypothetical protein
VFLISNILNSCSPMSFVSPTIVACCCLPHALCGADQTWLLMQLLNPSMVTSYVHHFHRPVVPCVATSYDSRCPHSRWDRPMFCRARRCCCWWELHAPFRPSLTNHMQAKQCHACITVCMYKEGRPRSAPLASIFLLSRCPPMSCLRHAYATILLINLLAYLLSIK